MRPLLIFGGVALLLASAAPLGMGDGIAVLQCCVAAAGLGLLVTGWRREGGSAPRSRVSPRRLILFRAIAAGIALLGCLAIYATTVVVRSARLSKQVPRWDADPFVRHPVLGYVPRPGGRARARVYPGRSKDVHFDEDGLRVTGQEPPRKPGEPLILFLGGSFTMGYGVSAADAFPHRTAGALGARAANAGVAAWGLAQMVLRARDDIPKLRPTVVVAQYSNWLPTRSLQYYGPTHWAKQPVPYFFERDGTIGIHAPAGASIMPDLELASWIDAGAGQFLWEVGIPLFLHDDVMTARISLASWLGVLPRPAARQPAVDFAYAALASLCDSVDAILVIVVIPGNATTPAEDQLPPSTTVIDTRPALLAALPDLSQETWEKHYAIWDGDRLADGHPNELMHERLATEIVRGIRQAQAQ